MMERLTQRRVTILALFLAIFAINAMVAGRLFGIEFSSYTSTNEGSFIAIGRILAEHGETLWWPFWDSGIPFSHTYSPLLPAIVAGFSALTHCSPALSFHIAGAFFYALGPATLFLCAMVLSGRRAASVIAALTYSAVSFSALISPVIRHDLGSAWRPRRLHVLVAYGEGPQTLALALLPLAILLFHLAVHRDRFGWKVAAGLACCAVVLANAFGAVSLALALGCLCITYTAPGTRRKAITLLVGLGAASYVFISPWLPPSLLRAIRANSPTVDGDFRYTAQTVWWLAGALVTFAVLYWLMRRTKLPGYVQFFLIFAMTVGTISLLGLQARVALLPQPHRYHLMMDMALSLVLACGLGAVLDRLPGRVQAVCFAVLLIIFGQRFLQQRKYAAQLIRPADLPRTIEYITAQWFNRHMPGQRVFVSGSSSFLFNVFSDNPQLHGGHDPFLPNFLQRIAAFMIYTGTNAGEHDAEYCILWLKAMGAHAITVSGPAGREFYKPFANPNKFDGQLPLLWKDGDDRIYGVPSRSSSIAHVIPRSALPARMPIHGLDVEPLRVYVDALEDPNNPLAEHQWQTLHSASIRTTVRAGDVISLQQTYAPGWRAFVAGKEQVVRADGIGFTFIEPTCIGECRIDLSYDGGRELLVARGGSAAVALAVVIVAFRRRKLGGTAV